MKMISTLGRSLLLSVFVMTFTLGSPSAYAASAAQINADVDNTLGKFYRKYRFGRGLANRARAVLVFPSVVKAGFGIGGEYGEGGLRSGDRTTGYYNLVSASVGFQLGVQARSIIIMFMSDGALEKFRRAKGWEIGVDGSVALITVGAAGTIDTNNLQSDTIGFVFNSKGLMYNLSLEGSKITRIRK